LAWQILVFDDAYATKCRKVHLIIDSTLMDMGYLSLMSPTKLTLRRLEMVSSDFTKNRVFSYMSRLWQEHAQLSQKRVELDQKAKKLKAELREMERSWVTKFFSRSVRKAISILKQSLLAIKAHLSKIAERCDAITKATASWAGVLVA